VVIMDSVHQEYRNMEFIVQKARAIKPNIIRFTIEHKLGDTLIGEYEISLDMESLVEIHIAETENEKSELKVDLSGLQQELTNAVAEMQFTNMVANKLIGITWNATQEEENDDEIQESSFDPE